MIFIARWWIMLALLICTAPKLRGLESLSGRGLLSCLGGTGEVVGATLWRSCLSLLPGLSLSG